MNLFQESCKIIDLINKFLRNEWAGNADGTYTNCCFGILLLEYELVQFSTTKNETEFSKLDLNSLTPILNSIFYQKKIGYCPLAKYSPSKFLIQFCTQNPLCFSKHRI